MREHLQPQAATSIIDSPDKAGLAISKAFSLCG